MATRAHRGFLIASVGMVSLGAIVAIVIALLPMTRSSSPVGFNTDSLDIGGPFTLIDHNGQSVTDADFLGKRMLVYFGYSFCPDVCPTDLYKLGQVMDMLGDNAEDIVPVFISIDPERDTPEQLAQYVALFHPKMVGLTGDTASIADVAKSYRVYYARAPQDGGGPDDYLMDHSSFVYLVGPAGAVRMIFSYGTSPEQIAEAVMDDR